MLVAGGAQLRDRGQIHTASRHGHTEPVHYELWFDFERRA